MTIKIQKIIKKFIFQLIFINFGKYQLLTNKELRNYPIYLFQKMIEKFFIWKFQEVIFSSIK